LNAFYPEFEPVPEDKVRPDRHPGVEFLYTISSKLEPIIGRVRKNRCGRVIVTV
jgi:hypothetical protein